MNPRVYILGDVDRVREQIERYLLGDTPFEVTTFSQRLSEGLRDFLRSAETLLAGETLMSGGDDILLSVERSMYSRAQFEELMSAFRQTTGCTISLGVGADVSTAYLNLRRAKAAGGGTIAGDADLVKS
jgi:hypothetical protein